MSLIDHLPCAVGVTAGRIVGFAAVPIGHCVGQVFPAVAPLVIFERLVRRHLVARYAILVGPNNLFAVRRMFKNLADATQVDAIHGPPDAATHDDTNNRPADDGRRVPLALSYGRTDCRSGDPA